jgi:hypothetical protein
MSLRVNRPGFLNGIRSLAKSDYPTPHLPSIERWRRDGRKGEYRAQHRRDPPGNALDGLRAVPC